MPPALPYGSEGWIQTLGRKLKLDLTIRHRARPRKQTNDEIDPKQLAAQKIK